MPDHTVTLEKIDKNKHIIVRARQPGYETIYFLADFENLKKLKSYPLTPHSYDYARLSNITETEFNALIAAKDNTELGQQVEQYNIPFQTSLLLNGATYGLFSNTRQGATNGGLLGLAASCFMTAFSNRLGEPKFSEHCLQTMLCSLIYGAIMGCFVSLNSRLHRDNPASADYVNKAATLLFFAYTALNIFAGFNPEFASSVLEAFGVSEPSPSRPTM